MFIINYSLSVIANIIRTFGWGTVIRTQECRSQSLYECFIYIIIYCYIIALKTALNQTILTPILSNLLFNTNYKITHFYKLWLDIG